MSIFRRCSTKSAVVHGIGRTGRLVASAALILFLAFVAMASGPETDIKTLATGPPTRPVRLLRVAPSPLRPKVDPANP